MNAMQYRAAPMRQGLYWLRQGAVTFFGQPMALGGLFLMAFMALTVVAMVPAVGLPLSLMFTPCVSFGLMAAVGELRAGRLATPGLLIEGLRGKQPIRRRNMVRLGLLYGALMLAWSVYWLGGVDWSSLVGPDGKPPEDLLEKLGPLLRAVMMVGLGNIPLLMIFMHAAALVYWSRSPVLQAVATSTLAMLRSLPAYIVFMGGLFLAVMAVSSLLNSVLSALGWHQLLMAFVFSVWATASCVALGGMFQAFVDCHPAPQA